MGYRCRLLDFSLVPIEIKKRSFSLKFIEKIVFVSVCVIFAAVSFTVSVSAQSRDRVIKSTSSQPTHQPPIPEQIEKIQSAPASRPLLTDRIILVTPEAANPPVVKKTAAAKPVNAPAPLVASAPTDSLIKKTASSIATNTTAALAAAGRTAYGTAASLRLDSAIKSRYGLPYHYGSTGPRSYDCSGFVWSVFREAGITFTRASARSLWGQSEPVYGDDRFKYGTLVFFNNLGHMGIVADENGFYQASSSKGITYSPFAGYWQGHIVGYRRLKPEAAATMKAESAPVEK